METQQPRTLSVHIPVTLLSLAIAVFIASQIGTATRNNETIKWQLENLEKGLTEIKGAEKQLGDIIDRAKPTMDQVQKVNEQYTNLFKEVLELSATDDDAKAVVTKWQIQSSQPAAGATPPAGAPAGAPAATPAPK